MERVAPEVERFAFERLYDNLGGTIDADARGAVRRSADRYLGWITGRVRRPDLTAGPLGSAPAR